LSTREQLKLPSSSRDHRRSQTGAPQISDTSSTGSPPAHARTIAPPPGYDYATEISELSIASAGRSELTIQISKNR